MCTDARVLTTMVAHTQRAQVRLTLNLAEGCRPWRKGGLSFFGFRICTTIEEDFSKSAAAANSEVILNQLCIFGTFRTAGANTHGGQMKEMSV